MGRDLSLYIVAGYRVPYNIARIYLDLPKWKYHKSIPLGTPAANFALEDDVELRQPRWRIALLDPGYDADSAYVIVYNAIEGIPIVPMSCGDSMLEVSEPYKEPYISRADGYGQHYIVWDNGK